MSVHEPKQRDVPDGYTETDRKAYDSQQACADAWAAMKWPSHNVRPEGTAILYASDNFRAFQHDSGSGDLMHYRTREAIRTYNGLILSNQQCWSGGFAHCSPPSDVDATVPLQAIESFLDESHNVYHVTDVLGQPEETDHGHTVHRPENSLVEIDGGEYYVAIGRDPSIVNGSQHFAFRAPNTGLWDDRDAEEIGRRIDHVLRPEAVAYSGMEVVDSAEYTQTRLSDSEQESHIDAGGKLSEIDRSWRGPYLGNRQHFRANLQGNVIVRQGEWFFIPSPQFEETDAALDRGKDSSARLGNHYTSRLHGAAITGSGELYVRGEIRHRNGDHNAVNLGDTWHMAVTHNVDCLTYRTGQRGTGGWD